MSNSVFDSKIKQMHINNLSDSDKQEHREKMLQVIFGQLANKENRYIFYCPDIVVVNNLVKLIYETAYEVQELGFKVLVLHEINNFKCKWLFEMEQYKHLKDVEVDYIIKKKSSKSKKTRAQYSFKPSDTLIVPDQFQEMLDNLADVKLMQKVLLVSSYTGVSSLVPATDYSVLGVKNLLFVEPKVQEDYESLFQFNSHVISYPINQEVFTKPTGELIYPVIAVSNIGNNDMTQAIINIFHAKYPNLRTFSFKVLPRDNYENYLNTLKHSAMLLVLDKNMGNNQMVLEAINMGVPVGTFARRESEVDELGDQIFLGVDAFSIADNIAQFCEQWLNTSTRFFADSVNSIATDLKLDSYTYDAFADNLLVAFNDLQQERVKYFTAIKQSVEKAGELV